MPTMLTQVFDGAEKMRPRRADVTRHLAAITAVLTATALAFLSLFDNAFVNWDDPFTIQNNPHLAAPGVVLWAFTTREMGHYQPLAWLAWSQTKAMFGLDPTAFHALSLLGHMVNVALVYLVTLRLVIPAGVEAARLRLVAVIAAFVFGVHPIQVEAVAWASAFPYVLSLTFLLAAFLAYLRYCRTAGSSRAGWFWFSVASYVLSQFTRASAVAFPAVLLLIDLYPLRRLAGDAKNRIDRRRPSWKRLLLEKTPFMVVALGAAIAESQARELATLQEVGVGARLTMAAPAPFIYLARTLLPLRLSPLDPLPIEPSLAWAPLILGLAGLAAVTAGLWRRRAEWPALAVAWAAYLLLLAPTMGLTPSGQQATADRYMYVPGVVTAVLASCVALALPRLNRLVITFGILAAAALGLATWRQAAWWHDSVSLWTRAAELDPRNDIALYNLAIALAAAGREDEAIGRYEQTLQLVPDHEFARRNLNLIRSAQAEREADRLAQAGNLDAAIDWYARALAVDPARLHARAARGVALVRRGRFGEAVADLREAFDAAERLPPDPANAENRAKEDRAVASALAFALAQIGNYADAAGILARALGRHGDDHELAHNLARLLATAPDRTVRDGPLALRLALAVRDETGGDDPRVLDTLAAAYAANGQLDLARETANQAARRARQLGHLDMARDIEAQARAYGQPLDAARGKRRAR